MTRGGKNDLLCQSWTPLDLSAIGKYWNVMGSNFCMKFVVRYVLSLRIPDGYDAKIAKNLPLPDILACNSSNKPLGRFEKMVY